MVVFGIGVDIVEIDRIRKAVERWDERFLQRLFTGKEIAHCLEKRDPAPSLAARFAAKEALVKALGRHIPFTDIEILNEPSGKPVISFRAVLPDVGVDHRSLTAHLTMSHERQHAVATVLLERKITGKV
ncbi:MAG: holo-ACP synthase [Nitrospirota bacterium]